MSKISLVIKREYLTRVRKKTFILMSIIGPILFAGLMIAPAVIANMEDKEEKIIAVIDDTYLFNDSLASKDVLPDSMITDSTPAFVNVLPNTEFIKFKYLENTSVEKVRKNFEESGYYALLFIPSNITYNNINSGIVKLYSLKQPTLDVQTHISNALSKELERLKLRSMGIDQKKIKSAKTIIDVSTIKWEEDGEQKKSSTTVATIVGLFSGILIYMFIFMYGTQVMRGVIEEKTNRIVEVIVSSIRPFQLMMGKIIGVMLVSLTQLLLWVIFTSVLVAGAYGLFFSEKIDVSQLGQGTEQQSQLLSETIDSPLKDVENEKVYYMVNSAFETISNIDFGIMIFSFVFFFLGGYLLYASLFAAVGSAVDNESDTQQFMLPITVPLILSIIMIQSIISNPDGSIAFWGSMIPFTSPIVMMARIPFGVPYWQVFLSIGLLIITFVASTWVASKIYRTGILMYGKKINYKELWKWIKY